jgi:hypothetical protein
MLSPNRTLGLRNLERGRRNLLVFAAALPDRPIRIVVCIKRQGRKRLELNPVSIGRHGWFILLFRHWPEYRLGTGRNPDICWLDKNLSFVRNSWFFFRM